MTTEARKAPGRLWTAENWPFILSVLGLMTFIAFESFAVTTILPVAMSDLGGARWYSLAYSATITAALVGMVIGGNWCDRSGPHRPLLVGGTLFLTGLALCVLAPDAATFVVGRLLQGIGGGIDSVVLYVLIARNIPERSRPRMFGLLTAAWLVPSMVGPVLAGALADLTNWRTVFGIILAGAAASLLCLLRVARGPAGTATVPPPAPLLVVVGRNGALALLAALLLLALHVGAQLEPPLSVLVLTAALIALVATARGILPAGTLLLRGGPQRLVALRAVLGSTVTATDIYLTLYLQTERGYPPTMAGLVIAIGALGWVLGAWVQGRYPGDQGGHQRLIRAAAPLVAVGPGCVLLYTTVALPLWVVAGACVVMGAGMGIAYPRLASATLELAKDQQGSFSSALQAGESMGVGAATALAAVVLASGLAAGSAFTLVYAILLGASGAAVGIAWMNHRSAAAPAAA